MSKIPKQAYTAEFKTAAVQRVKDGQIVSVAAHDLGVSEQTLHDWVTAEQADKLNGAGAKVITPEQMELLRLRAENKRLQRKLEIAKKVAAFFANGAGAKVITPEQMELSRLRAENKRLQGELEIAKKVAAFFAKDLL
jgi:transposase